MQWKISILPHMLLRKHNDADNCGNNSNNWYEWNHDDITIGSNWFEIAFSVSELKTCIFARIIFKNFLNKLFPWTIQVIWIHQPTFVLNLECPIFRKLHILDYLVEKFSFQEPNFSNFEISNRVTYGCPHVSWARTKVPLSSTQLSQQVQFNSTSWSENWSGVVMNF